MRGRGDWHYIVVVLGKLRKNTAKECIGYIMPDNRVIYIDPFKIVLNVRIAVMPAAFG